MKWYKLITSETHEGRGSKTDQVIYMWANEPIDALNKFQGLRAVPRSKLPDIIPLSQAEESKLEEEIIHARNWSVEKAKISGIRYSHKKYVRLP